MYLFLTELNKILFCYSVGEAVEQVNTGWWEIWKMEGGWLILSRHERGLLVVESQGGLYNESALRTVKEISKISGYEKVVTWVTERTKNVLVRRFHFKDTGERCVNEAGLIWFLVEVDNGRRRFKSENDEYNEHHFHYNGG